MYVHEHDTCITGVQMIESIILVKLSVHLLLLLLLCFSLYAIHSHPQMNLYKYNIIINKTL